MFCLTSGGGWMNPIFWWTQNFKIFMDIAKTKYHVFKFSQGTKM